MASTAWKSRPPLYYEVEHYLQKPAEWQDGLHSGITNFYECRKLMMSPEFSDDFRSGLSMSQLHSWRILNDWRVNNIMVRAQQRVDSSSNHNLGSSIKDALNESREPLPMALLWRHEFVQRDVLEAISGESFDMISLQATRWLASFTYARQRLAKSEMHVTCSQLLIGPHPLTKFPAVLGATPDPCPWLNLKRNELHTPHYFWDMRRRRTVLASKLGRDLTYLAISHTRGRWGVGGETRRINGVPWAVPQNSRFEVMDLPYLLTRLPFPVAYVWIDLLCIPQDNSRPDFEVIKGQEISRQASIFSGAACAMTWLNDTTDWRGLRQALEWSSIRYFKLFNSSLSTTNHIHNMGVTEEALEKLLNSTMSRIDMGIGLCDTTPLLTHRIRARKNISSWFSSLWTLQEAILRPDMLLCNGKFDVLTASEGFYVSFDMIQALMNAIGIPGFGGSLGYPLKKDVHSMELDSFFSSLRSSAPQTVLTLQEFIKSERLWTCLQSSPVTILNLASRRCSTGRRAEAIMSVIGATDWYQSEGAAGTSSTHDLIFGMYPSAFVLEVRNKLGGMFFLSGTLNLFERDLKLPDTGDLPDRNPLSKAKKGITLGTMLPFSPTIKGVVETETSKYCATIVSAAMCGNGHGYLDHPAVKTWRLRPNGNVLVELAAIEFSTFGSEELQPNTGNSASLEDRVNSTGGRSKAFGKLNIDPDLPEVIPEYTFHALGFTGVPLANSRLPPLQQVRSLKRLSFPGPKHAVCVGEFTDNDNLFRAGVILGGQYVRNSRYYVRIGYYEGVIPLQAKEARPLHSQKVDWLVL